MLMSAAFACMLMLNPTTGPKFQRLQKLELTAAQYDKELVKCHKLLEDNPVPPVPDRTNKAQVAEYNRIRLDRELYAQQLLHTQKLRDHLAEHIAKARADLYR